MIVHLANGHRITLSFYVDLSRRRHERLCAFREWCEQREAVIALRIRPNQHFKMYFCLSALSGRSSLIFYFSLTPFALTCRATAEIEISSSLIKSGQPYDTAKFSEEKSSVSLDSVLVSYDDRLKPNCGNQFRSFSGGAAIYKINWKTQPDAGSCSWRSFIAQIFTYLN